MGMKIPLMKSKGIRTKFNGIMMFPTDSVGNDANIIPIAANATHDNRIPRMKGIMLTIENPNNTYPTNRGGIETSKP